MAVEVRRLYVRAGGVGAGWVTDFSLILEKVDIYGSFCYTSELVERRSLHRCELSGGEAFYARLDGLLRPHGL